MAAGTHYASDLEELKQILTSFAVNVTNLVTELSDHFAKFLASLIDLPEVDSSIGEQKRECISVVQTAKAKAIAFLDLACKFFQYGDLNNDEKSAMLRSHEEGKLDRIKRYLSVLRMYFNKCSSSYEEFINAYDKAKIMCANIAEACHVEIQSAEKEKNEMQSKSKIVGAATTVGAVGATAAAGVSFAIAIAPITLGVGSLIALAVTGVASTTVAAATATIGGATALTALADAVKAAHKEGIFLDICRSMNEARNDLLEIYGGLKIIDVKLSGSSDDLKFIDETASDFPSLFNILLQGLKEGREVSESTIKKYETKFY